MEDGKLLGIRTQLHSYKLMLTVSKSNIMFILLQTRKLILYFLMSIEIERSPVLLQETHNIMHEWLREILN